jgi:isopenicillin N synthase-like dioxygenase
MHQQIDDACRNWGFFHVVDHGLDRSLINQIRHQMVAFFSMSAEQKSHISRTADNPWGYYDQELTKNIRDWKEIYDVGPAFTTNNNLLVEPQWPASLPEFRQVISRYVEANERLAISILEIIARNLAADPQMLRGDFQPDHTSFLRMNYYPVCPQPANPEGLLEPDDGHLGINRHTDSGAITLLLQDDQPGLQVYHDQTWHLVTPVPDAITVNIGDIVQVWSNDRYKAALHRVLASASSARYSVPFFFNPSYASDYAPLPSVVTSDNPAHYRKINWGEFRDARAAGDYANQGEEIQISQFRTNR